MTDESPELNADLPNYRNWRVVESTFHKGSWRYRIKLPTGAEIWSTHLEFELQSFPPATIEEYFTALRLGGKLGPHTSANWRKFPQEHQLKLLAQHLPELLRILGAEPLTLNWGTHLSSSYLDIRKEVVGYSVGLGGYHPTAYLGFSGILHAYGAKLHAPKRGKIQSDYRCRVGADFPFKELIRYCGSVGVPIKEPHFKLPHPKKAVQIPQFEVILAGPKLVEST